MCQESKVIITIETINASSELSVKRARIYRTIEKYFLPTLSLASTMLPFVLNWM